MWERLLRSAALRGELLRRAEAVQRRSMEMPRRRRAPASDHHEVRADCLRCGTAVLSRSTGQADGAGKLQRWLEGHRGGTACSETRLDRQMSGRAAPLIVLGVDGRQRTYGGRGDALVPAAAADITPRGAGPGAG